MRTVAQYLEEAERCRAMAAREKNAQTKATILQLADQFEELAAQREQMLKTRGSP